MTATQPQYEAPIRPSPIPPTRKPAVLPKRTWPAIDTPVWWVARKVALYPRAATALTAVVTMATPVTLREVSGVIVGGCSALGFRLVRSGGSPAGEPSLPDLAKFRKRKRLVRSRWVHVMADCGMAKPSVNGLPDKRRPRLLRIDAEPLGVRLLVDGSKISAGPDAFSAKGDVLRSGFKAKTVKINPSGHNTEIHLRYDQPRHFTQPLRLAELPRPTRPLHVVTGLDEDGFPVEKALWLPALMCGAQGSGKSTETWVILNRIIKARIPLRLRVFDPKGGQEFAELEDAAWEYVRNPAAWPSFVEHSHRTMAAKQAALRRRGIKSLTTFTEEFPLDVMVIDELLTAIAFSSNRKVKIDGSMMPVEDAFMVYLSTARAAGCTILANTQLAQKDVMGKFRGLFSYVTCLRVGPTERELVNILLGDGAAKNFPAHQLSARDAGIGYVATERGVVKYRAALPTAADNAATVRGIAAWTKRLQPAGASS